MAGVWDDLRLRSDRKPVRVAAQSKNDRIIHFHTADTRHAEMVKTQAAFSEQADRRKDMIERTLQTGSASSAGPMGTDGKPAPTLGLEARAE